MGNLSVLYGGIFQDMKSCKFSGARVGGLGNFRMWGISGAFWWVIFMNCMVENFQELRVILIRSCMTENLGRGKFQELGWRIFRSWSMWNFQDFEGEEFSGAVGSGIFRR